jgi:hypothetical protein
MSAELLLLVLAMLLEPKSSSYDDSVAGGRTSLCPPDPAHEVVENAVEDGQKPKMKIRMTLSGKKASKRSEG